jgi:hypothetical protein
LLGILAQHLFDGSDPGRQTEALEGAVHILPSRRKAITCRIFRTFGSDGFFIE